MQHFVSVVRGFSSGHKKVKWNNVRLLRDCQQRLNLEQYDVVTERQQIQPGSRLSDAEVGGKLSVNKEMKKLIKQL